MSTTRGTRTRLAFGRVTADIALYKTTGEPVEIPLERAAPSGSPIRTEMREVVKERMIDALTGEVDAEVVAEVQGEADRLSAKAARLREAFAVETEQVHVDAGTGEVITSDDFRRGIRHGERFVDLTEQLAAIDEAVKLDEMRIVGFVDVGQVPRERVQGSYYVGAAGAGAPKVLRLLYEAMKASRRVGVVKWSKVKNQALGILVPHVPSRTLMVLQVCWSDCWRPPPTEATTLQQAELTPAELEAATRLVAALGDTRGVFDGLKDDRRRMREDLVEAALMDQDWSVPAEPKEGALASAFAESLEAARG